MESNHPIPQDVTGFQFKLIGAMTVKQFLYLAVPSVIAWVLYSAPFLPLLIKLPIILFLAVGAVVVAFLPIEGRPADVMLKHFFKALFAPNQFIYQKTGQKLAFTTISTSPISQKPIVNPTLQAEQIKTRQLQALLQSSQHENMMDDRESSFMQKVSALMPTPTVINQTATSPSGKGILSFHLPQIFSKPLPSKPVLSNFKMVDLGGQPDPEVKPEINEQPKKVDLVTHVITPAPILTPPVQATSPMDIPATPQPTNNPILPARQTMPVPITAPIIPPYQKPMTVVPSIPQPTSNYEEQLKQLQAEKESMEKELVELKKQKEQPVISEPQIITQAINTPATNPQPVISSPATTISQMPTPNTLQTNQAIQQTTSSTDSTFILPPTPAGVQSPHVAKIPAAMAKNMGLPTIPDSPNLITGIVRDPRGNILPNILVEVKDKEGNPVRAFKTNQLGQFASATPLLNGTYTINFEDLTEQHKFDVIEIVAKGTILLPIGIVSHDAREELRKALFT